MSTYLSPIASSGESTPPNEEQEDRRLLETATTTTTSHNSQQRHQQRNYLRRSASRSSCDLSGADDEQEDDDEQEEEDEEDFEFDEALRASGIRGKLRNSSKFAVKPTNGAGRLKASLNGSSSSSSSSNNNNNSQSSTVNNNIEQTSDHSSRSVNGQQLIQNCYSKTGEQLHKLFQSASATLKDATHNSSNHNHSHANPNQTSFLPTTIGKKIKQLIKSIPIVPLVATSIMTIVILCFLLLSNTLMVATAFGATENNNHHQQHHHLQQQQRPQALIATGRLHHHRHHHSNNNNNNQPPQQQSESLILDQSVDRNPSSSSEFDGTSLGLPISQPQAGDAKLRTYEPPALSSNGEKLALRRELIENLLHQQQVSAHLMQPSSARFHSSKRQSPSISSSSNAHHQHKPDAVESAVEVADSEQQTPDNENIQQQQQQQQQAAQSESGIESLSAMFFGFPSAKAAAKPPTETNDDTENHQAIQSGDAVDSSPSTTAPATVSDEQTTGAPLLADLEAEFLDGEPFPSSSDEHFRRAHLRGNLASAASSSNPDHLRSAPLQQIDLSNLLDSPIVESNSGVKHQQKLTTRPLGESHHQQLRQQLQQQQQRHQFNNNNRNNNNNRQRFQQTNNLKHHQHEYESRRFDVAQIQCNNTEEGFERFACPSPDDQGRYRCIEDRLFCDGYLDCPGGEDEDRVSCMYYKLFVSHIDVLTNTFLTWIKKTEENHSTSNGAHNAPDDNSSSTAAASTTKSMDE